MTGERWHATGPEGLDAFEFVPFTAPEPGPGEIRIQVRAAGVNPADLKHIRRAASFPLPIGYEVSGVVTAVGDGTRFEIGDRVVAFRVHGGYATEITVPGSSALPLPETVDDVEAAGLLLAGTTAADMLHRSRAVTGETILMHGASGAVGATLLQLAARAGVRVIGTAAPDRLDAVTRFGGAAVPYGPDLLERIDGPVDAVLDLAGTAEAMEASLALVDDRSRIITAANKAAAQRHGVVAVAGLDPESAAFRDAARVGLIAMVAAGELVVPIARTFALDDAVSALALVSAGLAGGKVVLVCG
ncbi:quinone oxidoreductase family protein [Gordonia spumicola]|nr:NADP-dependent oxidoreductase [Gordonia spumicola]